MTILRAGLYARVSTAAKLDADYARLSAEAEKRLGLTDGYAQEDPKQASHTQAEPAADVGTTTPLSPSQEQQEPSIIGGEGDRAFFNNPGHLTGQSPRRFKDDGFIW
jgi:hypothetical protein